MFKINPIHTPGRSDRFGRQSVLLFIFIITAQLLPCRALNAESFQSPSIELTQIRGWYHESWYHESYSSVVFQFSDRIRLDDPVITEDEVLITFKDATTPLDEFQEFKQIDSWVRMEPVGDDLTVHIGLPANFSDLSYYRRENPYRLIIKMHKGKNTLSAKTENKTPDETDTIAPIETQSSPSILLQSISAKPLEDGVEVLLPEPVVKKEKPAVKLKEPERKDRIVSNDLLTLNFYQSDIQEILSALAMEREINIATAQDVSGKVSVQLYQVTLDEALDAITLAGGFQYYKYGDLYYIYKSKETKDPQEKKLEMKIFRMKYAEMDKIKEILEGFPDMGTIQLHKPSKTLIVEDTAEHIQKIETIVSHWDRAPKQVMIEAKILEVSLKDDMEFGVDWSKILGDLNISTGGFSRATLPTDRPVNPSPGDQTGIFTNLITGIGSQYQFATALDALQNKTKVNTLSTPKVFAIHGKPAKVQVGGQQGYRVTTTNLGVATETIEFIDTGTVLEITPFIDDDGNILLEVLPSITDAELDEGIPVTKTTAVSTWLLAKDGQTIFIGGLIQDKKEKTRNMIPCLGSIDGIGALFGRTVANLEKKELIFLITPRIFDGMPTRADLEAIEKSNKLEEKFSKEPLPIDKQMLDFIAPVK